MDWGCKGKHISVCKAPAGEEDEEEPTASEDEKDNEISATDEVVDKVCKKGWHAFGNSCYLIGPVKNNNGAKLFCQQRGATLASIGSKAENKAVSALLGKKYVSLFKLILCK